MPLCPFCHQRRVRSTSDWIATAVCHEVPHRQFVFTIPKVLRGIFRKRRQLLTHRFHTAIEPDLDWFNRPRNPSNPDPDGYDQSQTWQAPEIHLEEGRILVLEST